MKTPRNRTEIGQRSEDVAAQYLRARGFAILDRNWRSRWAVIDIVARKGRVIHFVEVKYRRTSRWGKPMEYMDRRKLSQMQQAAQHWLASYDWNGEVSVDAVAVSSKEEVEYYENVTQRR